MNGEATGRITMWKAEKGFGFITPDAGGKDVFFHVSEIHHSRHLVAQDVRVGYSLTYDEQQRPQAIRIHFEQEPFTPLIVPTLTAGGFFAVLMFAVFAIPLPTWILAPYAVMSIVTFTVYGSDKSAAVYGRRRVPEATLHWCEMLGGWPGALIAQEYYHHKSAKRSYQALFWGIVGLHLLLLVGYSFIAINGYALDLRALSTW